MAFKDVVSKKKKNSKCGKKGGFKQALKNASKALSGDDPTSDKGEKGDMEKPSPFDRIKKRG